MLSLFTACAFILYLPQFHFIPGIISFLPHALSFHEVCVHIISYYAMRDFFVIARAFISCRGIFSFVPVRDFILYWARFLWAPIISYYPMRNFFIVARAFLSRRRFSFVGIFISRRGLFSFAPMRDFILYWARFLCAPIISYYPVRAFISRRGFSFVPACDFTLC